MASGRTSDIDRFVARRISQLRALNGMTQQQLAEAIGKSYQQITKYELSINRLSASKLLAIANALNVPVSALFDGLEEGGTRADEDRPDPQLSRMLIGFLQVFRELEPKQQRMVARLVRALAADPPPLRCSTTCHLTCPLEVVRGEC